MATIKLLIADSKDELRNNIRRMLNNQDAICIVGEAKDGPETLSMVKELQPHIVLLDLDLPVIDGLKVIELLAKEYPTVQCLVMSMKSDPEYILNSMKSGAKDFLREPFNASSLTEAIMNVYNKWLKDKEELFEEKDTAKVVTLFSTKGGVGKTTLAINIASALAAKQKRTLLIDASLQFGNVAITLDLHPKSTISNIVESSEYAADDIIRRTTKHASGLDVLVAPLNPAKAEEVRGEHLQKIIEAVKPLYQFIIVDMPAVITEKELAILDKTTILFLIATLEITSLKNTKACLKTLEEINYDMSKVKIILNKDMPDVGIDKANIEQGLGIPVYSVIPMDDAVVQPLNKGEPIVLKSPFSLISRTIIDIAEKLVGPAKKQANTSKSTILRIKDLLFGN